jgi:hypothetical protein
MKDDVQAVGEREFLIRHAERRRVIGIARERHPRREKARHDETFHELSLAL